MRFGQPRLAVNPVDRFDVLPESCYACYCPARSAHITYAAPSRTEIEQSIEMVSWFWSGPQSRYKQYKIAWVSIQRKVLLASWLLLCISLNRPPPCPKRQTKAARWSTRGS